MKRRSFLGLLGGVFAAPAIKVNADAKPIEFKASAIEATASRHITIAPYEPDPNAYANMANIIRMNNEAFARILEAQARGKTDHAANPPYRWER